MSDGSAASKIMVVGSFGSAQRDAAIAEGFRRCGCSVIECGYGDLLYSANIAVRVQLRLGRGPIFRTILNRVVAAATAQRPDVVLLRMPVEFSAEMLRDLRRAHPAVYAAFNNDDPFSRRYTGNKWNRFRGAIPEYDIVFAFRTANLRQYREAGAKRVALWEPFYSPWIHHPVPAQGGATDAGFRILFAMHAERDERRPALIALRGAGYDVQLHSWNWHKVFGRSDARRFGVRPPIWGVEYARAISQSSATLCFFSKQNNDELTSRVFEIPACGGLLLSRRTKRLTEFFEDRDEAFFFSSVPELLEVTHALAASPSLVDRTKQRGMRRLGTSRHSVVDRCEDALSAFRGL
jgi:hypothetical protein